MRKALTVLVVVASFGPTAGTALAATAGPPVSIPKDCHEWNELLGIQNVRDCNGG